MGLLVLMGSWNYSVLKNLLGKKMVSCGVLVVCVEQVSHELQ